MEKQIGSYKKEFVNSSEMQTNSNDCLIQNFQLNKTHSQSSNVTTQSVILQKLPLKRNPSVHMYKKKHVTMSQGFHLFCTTTSIRGMGKVAKGPIFLRILWTCFVIIMTTGLIVATTFMVMEYLQYDVNVNTKMILDDPSSFPALTICHHHPFSTRAYDLWENSTIQSPSDFNKNLRDISKAFFQKDKFELGFNVAHFDTMSMYYQNVNFSDILRLGHAKSSYLTCMSQTNMMVDFEDDCSKLRNTVFRTISHHEYFNCHTFEPNNIASSYEIDSLNIVVSLEPEPNYTHHEQAFIVDTFQRSQGLRVVIHELGSYPDVSKDGLHVEPGKMNEIKYQPIRYKKLNSPAKHCLTENDTNTFLDLSSTYIMDKAQCIQVEKQKRIMKDCKCIFVVLPRPESPTLDLPYCGKFTNIDDINKTIKRIECIQDILNDRDYQTNLEKNKCFPRCETLQFENTISITKWGATSWHLYWIRKSNQELNKMEKEFNLNQSINVSQSYKNWLDYSDKSNLSETNSSTEEQFMKGDNFAYVVLQRKTKNTVLKLEKLVTTSYVLLSRFGGLCSITIGLTAAFAVEFIEFLYKYMSNDDADNKVVKEKVLLKVSTKNPWKKKTKRFNIFENKIKLKNKKIKSENVFTINDNSMEINPTEIVL